MGISVKIANAIAAVYFVCVLVAFVVGVAYRVSGSDMAFVWLVFVSMPMSFLVEPLFGTPWVLVNVLALVAAGALQAVLLRWVLILR